MAKGIVSYVPPSVNEELQIILTRKKLRRRADAFKEMVRYSKVGREAEDILNLRFFNVK
jgi:hypothetical protein